VHTSAAIPDAIEKLDGRVSRFTLAAQGAEALAQETAARYTELEHAIAANFSIVLTSKGG
jgi:hypothetical protein